MFVLLGQKNIKMKYMQKYQTLLKNFIDLIKIQCLENIIQLKHEKNCLKHIKVKKIQCMERCGFVMMKHMKVN